jgi:hypothetical protein
MTENCTGNVCPSISSLFTDDISILGCRAESDWIKEKMDVKGVEGRVCSSV